MEGLGYALTKNTFQLANVHALASMRARITSASGISLDVLLLYDTPIKARRQPLVSLFEPVFSRNICSRTVIGQSSHIASCSFVRFL